MSAAAHQPPVDARVAGLKVPPHSIEAEQAVIGAALLDQRAASTAVAMLTEGEFYEARHRLVFRVLAELLDRGETPDAMVVARKLEDMREAGRMLDMAYLAELAENAPGVSNVAAYCRVVRERAERRRIIGAANEMADRAFAGGEDVLEVCQRLGASIGGAEAEEGAVTSADALRQWAAQFDRRRNGEAPGISTGHRALDERWIGLRPGCLYVLGGRPSMGKTLMAMDIAEHVAGSAGRVLVFSMEMPADELTGRRVSRETRLDGRELLRGQMDEGDWPKLSAALRSLRERPLLVDDTPALHIAQVRARARHHNAQERLALVVIDYLQLMRGDGRTRAEEIGSISRGCKRLAKELGLPVLLLSQLNRGVESRPKNDRRPRPADLRESGDIEQDADVIAFTYRHEVYEPETQRFGVMEIITAKVRAGVQGHDYLLADLARSRVDDTPEGWHLPPQAPPRRFDGRDEDDDEL
jgi:replicative DNA helicase